MVENVKYGRNMNNIKELAALLKSIFTFVAFRTSLS